jgi:ABC-type transport system substrate-binding protein
VERVEIALLDDTAWRDKVALYEADEVDALDTNAFPMEEKDRVRQQFPDQFNITPVLATSGICFNVNRPPLDDVRVRQALGLATDRETLAGGLFRGYLRPATGGLVPPGMPGHSPGIGLPYDPKRARRLLLQAGYPDRRGLPSFTGIWPCDNVMLVEAAHFFTVQWRRELGVEVDWQYVPDIQYSDRVQQEQPHLSFWVWTADYPDPDNFLRVGFGRDTTDWRNEKYDRLVAQARRLVDQRERITLYRRADRIIAEEAPFLLGGYGQSVVLLKPWVKRLSRSVLRDWSSWKEVIIEPH